MKTLVYHGPRHVSMTDAEDARIERPTDVLVRVTHTGAAYGFADLGPWRGSQAEYLRMPWGDINCLWLPEDVHASIVMVVDRHADRLRLAEGTGCIPIDDSKVPPVDQVLGLTRGAGGDCACQGVGDQAHDPKGHEDPDATLNDLVKSVRFTGSLGVVGVFVPEDPGAPADLARHGQVAFEYGMFWFKGQRMCSGQCPVRRYNQRLRNLIDVGNAKPSCLVSRQLFLTSAPDAYAHFDRRDTGWTKVVLSSGETNGESARQAGAGRVSAHGVGSPCH